ncbi:DEAD/DEAH box helicase family protein [Porticoccaceae bacterium]|nr:DEAD/DEAH box helicase family protein [Porticoccaceae bacterium]
MNHGFLKAAYDNDSGSISEDFLVPCLESCLSYRRTTYSFTSAVLRAWAGVFSRLVSQDIKIEILCDMSQICTTDDQLIEAMENTVTPESRLEVITSRQDSILLDALRFDTDSNDREARGNILEWMMATDRFELKFAWPKVITSGQMDLQPLFHKKMGYFTFGDGSIVGFTGSWNETVMGSRNNLEDCSVFSSTLLGDSRHLSNIITKVDQDWNGNNKKFDIVPVSKKTLDIIKARAPIEKPGNLFPASVSTNIENNPSPSEECLRPYQLDVLNSWERSDRRGIVKHATGSGKTYTALFAIKRHLMLGGVCLVIVPSRLLLKQWNEEIVKIIPEAKNKILNAGTGYSVWKSTLRLYSQPQSSSSTRIIVAITNTVATDLFLEKLCIGSHLMVVSDEVHVLGSSENRKILDNIDAGCRLGLSATPERFFDPEGTRAIFEYFGGILDPIYELKDAIGNALVPYDYYPIQCALTEIELENWLNLSIVINKLVASCNRDNTGQLVPTKLLKLKLIERSRIAKQAHNKIELAKGIIMEHFKYGEKWLVYCDSSDQMQTLADSLSIANISFSFYYSKMTDEQKIASLNGFKANGGVLISIKCLDEGVDIPSVTHALIIASDQNPRQFIQRRGRVLRKDPLNESKNKAYIWDIIITAGDETNDPELIKGLCIAEMKRSIEFSDYAFNREISSKTLRRIARKANITNKDLADALEDIEEPNEDKH